MPKKASKKSPKYFTINFEKFIQLLVENEKFCLMVSYKIKEIVDSVSISQWEFTPLDDFAEAYFLSEKFKYFLEEKINSPTEEEIKFTTQNNIKDVLLDEEELQYMQKISIRLEKTKDILIKEHGFSIENN